MAERRMFAKKIVTSDAFLDMPMSARCLYFTLGMEADDDGFIGNPKAVMRQCGASQDDMAVLLQKRFLLGFESGIIVIKHWRMNNLVRKDRYAETSYLEEKATLTFDDKGSYTECDKDMVNPYTVNPGKDSIGKDSIGKDSLNNSGPKSTSSHRFVKPTLEEINQYILEKELTVDADTFYDHYETNGWKVGKNGMKDWKAALRNWSRREQTNIISKNKESDRQKKVKEQLEAYLNGK